MAWIKSITGKASMRGVFVCIAILFALPLGWGGLTGLSLWFSPFLMLNSVFVLKSVVWLNGLAAISLVLLSLRKRWFCRRLCPLGWGCDLVSSLHKGRGRSLKKVPPIGKWLALSSLLAALAGIPLFILLDPMSIFNGFFVIFSQEFSVPVLLTFLGLPLVLALNIPFPGIWCAKLCPLGGLQDEITWVKSSLRHLQHMERTRGNLKASGRRLFLVSGAGLAAGLLLSSFMKPKEKSFLRPPGSIAESGFNTLCLRCGSCIKSCPTGILKHHMDPSRILSWMVPEVSFTEAYCLEHCNTCSRVCPSGAITLFSKEAKAQMFMGLAEIDLQNCLLSENKECDRCKAACPYNAIKIEPAEGALQMQPVVIRDACVGCGACVVICPPRVVAVLP